jgi:hypothetical protein
MLIAEVILAHMVGDYLLQSHWMAVEKTKHWWPAIVHGVAYGLPFLLITQNVWALLVIVGTHIVIDRYRLARHVTWFKNQVGPAEFRPSWEEAKVNAGFSANTPAWLSTWLMIIADNTLHVLINIAAIALF